ncbi:PREDICTED: WAT1-related protein At2g39510-like [Tarenaya hassleriana]|uniref:WAT1-related protein At2g39510-like n=1 Tax=Tarenaya hassleriana TaxID=28532 RepID=UPI00053CA0CE|nr:PREDICTED: WAT1-related protein At2g39510-like [Tarenaya hassleriana]
MWREWKAPMAVILLQFGYAGLSITANFALRQGMSPHVLIVYRHAIATLFITPFALFFDRKVRPKMTWPIFIKIVFLGLLEPTIGQNLFYTGMKYTSPTFTSAMSNVLPAFAFLMAWIFRLEKVDIRRVHSQAMIMGTIVTVGGAMAMALVKGPSMDIPWVHNHHKIHDMYLNLLQQQSHQTKSTTSHDPTKGALFVASGCLCWAAFTTLQALTLKAYPAVLSLAAWICFIGATEGSIAALVMERHNISAWSLHIDIKLFAAVYSGVICSGVGYYVQGMIMRKKGPVFVTAFNPLSMVIVTIISSLVFHEGIHLGRVTGSILIVVGLYLVLWGKSKDQTEALPNSDIEKTAATKHRNKIYNENEERSDEETRAIEIGPKRVEDECCV